MEDCERIFIGDKDIKQYIPACLFALNSGKDIMQITARGNNIKRAIDVAAIMLRQHLDIPEIPTIEEIEMNLEEGNIKETKKLLKALKTCEIKIGTEQFQDRNVSTIDIFLRGKKKNVPAKKD